MKCRNAILLFADCLVALVLMLTVNYSFGQVTTKSNVTKPEIGKPLPDFNLGTVTYFNKARVTQDDLKGKWLFLDFWFPGCSSCIQSFPKVNEIHKEFKSDLTWLMIGLNDRRSGKNVREFYEGIRVKRKLEMPVAYDSILAKKWEIHAMPYIVVVDPSGIVRYITDGRNITIENVKKLINGEDANFYQSNAELKKANLSNLSDSLTNNLVFKSLISKWNNEEQWWVEIDSWVTWSEDELQKGYKLTMAPLVALYYFAHVGRFTWDVDHDSLYGKFYNKPILEVADTTPFNYSFGTDVSGKVSGMYNYNLILPTSQVTAKNLTMIMREDLDRAFNYEVSIETKEVPVWKLIAKPGAIEKLKTKGGARYYTPGTHIAGYTLKNMEPKYLIGNIAFYMMHYQPPFLDETGLQDKFDFTLKADMTDIEDVRKEIRKQGLDLVKGTKKMFVLVIRDKKGS